MVLGGGKVVADTDPALETRGFTFAGESAQGRRMRLAYLKAKPRDAVLIAAALALVAAAFALGHHLPLLARDC